MWQARLLCICLICDFCSLDREFALGLLHTPPPDGHTCPQPTVPTAKPEVDFHHLVTAHYGQTKKCLSKKSISNGHKCFKDIQLNSCCVVKRNPACTTFQLTPTFDRACALFCFNNGENFFACEPACCGVVRAGTFADVQIWN